MPTDDYIKRSDALNELYRDASATDPMIKVAYRVDVHKRIESIPAANVEPKQRWIPAPERVPEEKINPNTHDFEYVLCATVFGDVRPFKFGTRIGETQPHFWNGAGYADAYINHWMPLPELPKGETND